MWTGLALIDFWLHCQVYKNPYNHGRLNNWKLFLGVEKRRCVFLMFNVFFLIWLMLTSIFESLFCSHWVTRVLLPSGHSPHGDGLTWESFPPKKDLIPVWQSLPRLFCCLRSAADPVCSLCGPFYPDWPKGSISGDSVQQWNFVQPPIPQTCSVALLVVMHSIFFDGLFSSGFYLVSQMGPDSKQMNYFICFDLFCL